MKNVEVKSLFQLHFELNWIELKTRPETVDAKKFNWIKQSNIWVKHWREAIEYFEGDNKSIFDS